MSIKLNCTSYINKMQLHLMHPFNPIASLVSSKPNEISVALHLLCQIILLPTTKFLQFFCQLIINLQFFCQLQIPLLFFCNSFANWYFFCNSFAIHLPTNSSFAKLLQFFGQLLILLLFFCISITILLQFFCH